jgi:hypothetical protein
MKLSTETIAIMNNFSNIQPGIIIPPGNTIKTRTGAFYAQATVLETFPVEVRIDDVHDFLRMVGLFKDPEFDFAEDSIRIAEVDGTAVVVYPQAQPGSPVQLPIPKQLKPEPDEQITFTISEEQWARLQQAFGLFKKKKDWQKKSLVIVSDGKTVRLNTERAYEKAGYSLTVDGVTNGFECTSTLDARMLRLVDGSYEVMVTPMYARFRHVGNDSLLYYVASEPKSSTWGGKQAYLVTATKSMAQDCQFNVLAHSPEEAESIVRQRPAEDYLWTAGSRRQTTFTAVAG